MFLTRNPAFKSPPTWAGIAPMSWKLALAGGILAVLAVAGVL